MITRLHGDNNGFTSNAIKMFATAKPCSKSYFFKIQEVFLQYVLPHPVNFFQDPPSKDSFKKLVKAAVMDYWEKKLRAQAAFMKGSSLRYFDTNFMSLSTIHPLFSTCGSNPYEVSKAVVQARWLSGRARVESLTRHWDMSNKVGMCLLCRDVCPTLGTIEHFLLSGGCPALAEARLSMLNFFQSYMVSRPYLLPIFQSSWDVDNFSTMQLLLDCSVIPTIIKLSENQNNTVMSDIFYLTRTFVFKIYLTRRGLLETM